MLYRCVAYETHDSLSKVKVTLRGQLEARGPHVEPICQSIYKYSLLPLSVTFNIDSHWFNCDTPYQVLSIKYENSTTNCLYQILTNDL